MALIVTVLMVVDVIVVVQIGASGLVGETREPQVVARATTEEVEFALKVELCPWP